MAVVADMLIPTDRGGKEATFAALSNDFGFDNKVRDLFVKGPMETLEDFRYYFAEEKEIDLFVAADETLKGAEQKIQIARVRRAWAAVRHNGLRKESRNTISSVAELDDLLEEGTLREVKVQFWTKVQGQEEETHLGGGKPIGSAVVPLLQRNG